MFVFRASEMDGYEFLDQVEKFSFVCSAAYDRPYLNQDGTLTEEYYENTIKKVRSILSIGVQNGHTSFVLSAFGCVRELI